MPSPPAGGNVRRAGRARHREQGGHALQVLVIVHLVLGIALLAVSAVLAVWAFVIYRRRQPLPPAYWRALQLPAGLLVVQILTGLVFLTQGRRPGDPLHFMYAGLITAGIAAQQLLQPRAAMGRMMRREGTFNEAGTYALITFVVALLAMRLWQTGP